MATDPRWPDRPDHPFFWEISNAVIVNDESALERRFHETTRSLGIHAESVRYVSEQRISMLMSGHESTEVIAQAAWVDGFAAAMRLMHNRLVKDGQHR